MPEAQKHLRCRDVGLDCDFEAHGSSEDDVMRQAADHAATEHGMSEVSDDLAAKIRERIKDE